MQSTPAEIREVVNETPLELIKSELPEICTLVATLRMMAIDSGLADTRHNAKKQLNCLLDLLFEFPINDTIPSLEQRKASESFLFAASTYTSSFGRQLDTNTEKLRQSCKAFKDAMAEMERLKTEVVNKYKKSILEFDDIVKYADLPGPDESASGNLETIIENVICECTKNQHQKTLKPVRRVPPLVTKKKTSNLPPPPPIHGNGNSSHSSLTLSSAGNNALNDLFTLSENQFFPLFSIEVNEGESSDECESTDGGSSDDDDESDCTTSSGSSEEEKEEEVKEEESHQVSESRQRLRRRRSNRHLSR